MKYNIIAVLFITSSVSTGILSSVDDNVISRVADNTEFNEEVIEFIYSGKL